MARDRNGSRSHSPDGGCASGRPAGRAQPLLPGALPTECCDDSKTAHSHSLATRRPPRQHPTWMSTGLWPNPVPRLQWLQRLCAQSPCVALPGPRPGAQWADVPWRPGWVLTGGSAGKDQLRGPEVAGGCRTHGDFLLRGQQETEAAAWSLGLQGGPCPS